MSPVKNPTPFEKEEEIHKKVLKTIKNNPSGLTTTDVQKISKVSRKTLEKHLSLLTFENEIHMSQFGPTRVYYPNKKIKNFKSENVKIGNRIYFFDLLENQYGKFYLIQEKKSDKNKLKTKGSILIPDGEISNFIKGLNKLSKK
ncbi:hypothetical protein GOV08_04925 [Candidatus Woesearchaeota archaeon]|nr:hypothetical protein [Candidatus Woesearchaeota archaeon]